MKTDGSFSAGWTYNGNFGFQIGRRLTNDSSSSSGPVVGYAYPAGGTVHAVSKKLLEVTPETFASAMKRTCQDYELSRGRQPNARMKGMGAKEDFHKNVEANNDAYSPDGQNMHKWTSAIYWGTDESRGMSGTVNESGFDFITG